MRTEMRLIMMRLAAVRAGVIFCVATAALLETTVPAVADYGAVAYDQTTRKQGVAWSEDTQQRANQLAMRECGSEQCKVRFGVPPGMCGAFATPDAGPAWGGAVKKSLDDARFAAMRNCQKNANRKCTLRENKCTKQAKAVAA